MISSSKKGADLVNARLSEDRTKAIRMAALVAFVWTIAVLPFFVGAVRCPTAHLFHFPCPGCGMTRAFHLLSLGQIKDSLAMHAMAVPTLLAQAVLAIATIASTFRFGAPWSLMRASWGRAAVWIIGIVLVLDILLWIARAAGAFGGPVPV
jgi:hypothetical protein